MSTNDALNNPLSGSTGTGQYVGDNTPTLITPDIGAATGTSLNLGASTTIDSVIDDDTMATASDTNCSTSEAIVAYIASQIAAGVQVVQYVVATDATDDTSTSATLADSSLTASITPTSASNRILVITNSYVSFTTSTGGTQNYAVVTGIRRSTGTPATLQGSLVAGHAFNTGRADDVTYNVVTNMGTEIAPDTSSHTYALQFARLAASGTATCHGTDGPKLMVIMELLV